MSKLKPEGKCFYCNKFFTGSGISRHLSTHLKSIEKDKQTNKKSYHIKVTAGKLYFLHLLMDENSDLERLDYFLRNIWLECCGHMSSFEIKGAPTTQDWLTNDYEFGIDPTTKIGDLLEKGLTLDYQYDFGSTTYLEINVLNEYLIQTEEEILLLSRNEPLKILCDLCKKEPAQVMCSVWHHEGSTFCNSCKDIHAKQCSDFADYAEVSIVNSPRVGVCGYEAGTIDTERDGVWKRDATK